MGTCASANRTSTEFVLLDEGKGKEGVKFLLPPTSNRRANRRAAEFVRQATQRNIPLSKPPRASHRIECISALCKCLRLSSSDALPRREATGVRFAVLQQLRDRAAELEARDGPVAADGGIKRPIRRAGQALTTEDVFHEIVAPCLSGRRPTYHDVVRNNSRYGGALAGTFRDLGPATVHVSHSWREKFSDLVDAIATVTPPEHRDACFCYIDVLAEPQRTTVPHARPPSWWYHVLRRQIAAVGRVILVLSPWNQPLAFECARCLYEIDAVTESGAEIIIALPKAERSQLYRALAAPERSSAVLDMVALVDDINPKATKAQATPTGAADRMAVLQSVQDDIGVTAFVAAVQLRLYEWITDLGTKALRVLEADGEDGPLELRMALASVNRQLGHHLAAQELLMRQVEASAKTLGEASEQTLAALNSLALLLRESEQYDEAEVTYRRVLRGCEKVFGRSHPHTLTPAYNLAVLLKLRGKHTEAVQLFRRVVRGRQATSGEAHEEALVAATHLAATLLLDHKYAEAEEHARMAYAGRARTLGRTHETTLRSVQLLVEILEANKKLVEAEKMRQQHGLGRAVPQMQLEGAPSAGLG